MKIVTVIVWTAHDQRSLDLIIKEVTARVSAGGHRDGAQGWLRCDGYRSVTCEPYETFT